MIDPAAGPPGAGPGPDGSPPARSARQPGEALPAGRRLARPPGDRYRRPAPEPVLEHPDVPRALLLGGAAGAAIAGLMAIFHAVLSNAVGQIAIPIAGGCLIGWAVRRGAWSGRLHRPTRGPEALAGGLGAATWLGGLVLAWVLSQAILPVSTRSLPDRLAATPFLEWLGPQLGPIDAVRLLLLVSLAWLAARSPHLERPAGASPDG